MKQWKLAYAGFDIKTFFLLVNDEKFELKVVAYDDALMAFDHNPINWIAACLYRKLCNEKKSAPHAYVLFILWKYLKFLSTGIYHRHREYISTLYERRIIVLNLDDDSSVEFLKKEIDLLVVNVWGLLNKEIIFACKYGAFNIHPSKLPKYRGSQPTLWALKNNDTSSAVTFMLLDEAMDTGAIINQHGFDIDVSDDWRSLEVKVARILSETLTRDIDSYLAGNLKPFEQDDAFNSKTATYSGYRKILWDSERAVDIYNKVNLYPHLEHGVYCYFRIGERRILIKGCRYGKYLKERKMFELAFKSVDGYVFCKLVEDISFTDYFLLIFRKPQSLVW